MYMESLRHCSDEVLYIFMVDVHSAEVPYDFDFATNTLSAPWNPSSTTNAWDIAAISATNEVLMYNLYGSQATSYNEHQPVRTDEELSDCWYGPVAKHVI